jgi:hypothetical protein
MYDNLLSTHRFQDWGARPDPVTETLDYSNLQRTGDTEIMASVPIQITNPVQGKGKWRQIT